MSWFDFDIENILAFWSRYKHDKDIEASCNFHCFEHFIGGTNSMGNSKLKWGVVHLIYKVIHELLCMNLSKNIAVMEQNNFVRRVSIFPKYLQPE